MSIGKIYAFLDYFEGQTSKPTTSSILKLATGVTRTELRYLERQKRLDVFYITDKNGTCEKGYLRPKERNLEAVLHG